MDWAGVGVRFGGDERTFKFGKELVLGLAAEKSG